MSCIAEGFVIWIITEPHRVSFHNHLHL